MDFDIAQKYKIKYSDIVVIVCSGNFCFVQDSDARLLFSKSNKVVGHNGAHSINVFEAKRLDAIISILIELHIDYLVMNNNQPTYFRRFKDNAYSKHSKARTDDYYFFVHVIRGFLKKYCRYDKKEHYFMYVYETLPNSIFENPISLYDGSSVILTKGYLPITKLVDLTKRSYLLGNKDARWEFSSDDDKYSRILDITPVNYEEINLELKTRERERTIYLSDLHNTKNIERVCRNCGKYGTDFCISSEMNCKEFRYIR